MSQMIDRVMQSLRALLVGSVVLLSAGQLLAQRCSDQLRFLIIDSQSLSQEIHFYYDSVRANNSYELKGRYFDRLQSPSLTGINNSKVSYEVEVDQIIRMRGADSVERYLLTRPFRGEAPAQFSTGCGGVFILRIMRSVAREDASAGSTIDTMTIRFDHLAEAELGILIPYIPGHHLVTTGKIFIYDLEKDFAGSRHPAIRAGFARYYSQEQLFMSYEITPHEWRDVLERWLTMPQDR